MKKSRNGLRRFGELGIDMKRYNYLMGIMVGVYVIVAVVVWMSFTQTDTNEYAYRVAMNRYMENVEATGEVLSDVDLEAEGIGQVSFLSADEINEEATNVFFTPVKQAKFEIVPWHKDGELKGYVKFSLLDEPKGNQVLWVVEGCLLVIVIFILGLMWYVKKQIIQPFLALDEMPLEIAKGHYKKDILVAKHGYFKSFLWGMGQLKDALDVSRKRQLELEKEKKQLLLSLSHDIKTPLNLIKLYKKALEEDICKDEASRYQAIHHIREKAEEIEKYVDAIIKTSREDILDLQVEEGEFYLADLMKQTMGTYAEQCENRHIELRIQPYQNCIVKGDIDRAQEVLENLFENAFKYGDGRYIEIAIYEEDGHQLMQFMNSGVTLQDQDFLHVFESFYRGANVRGQAGSGLGLYICKELMRKMSGTIFARQVEDGMAFVLVFQS